jgi:hypothetical protein
MAKCIAVKMVGQNCEIAVRVDGVQFERKYGFNGYSNAWSKWSVVLEHLCINFDAVNMDNLPRYRLPDCEASYTRNTYYTTVLEISGLPCVTIYSVDEKYSNNSGAYQVAHGVDENGNFTQECNMYDDRAFTVTNKEECILDIEITPAIIEAAKHLQSTDGDYWPGSYPAIGLPAGVQMYNYFDEGIWLVNNNNSCNMDDATKLVCVLAAQLRDYQITFNGRMLGSIGIMSDSIVLISAISEGDAIKELYKTYEHIRIIKTVIIDNV